MAVYTNVLPSTDNPTSITVAELVEAGTGVEVTTTCGRHFVLQPAPSAGENFLLLTVKGKERWRKPEIQKPRIFRGGPRRPALYRVLGGVLTEGREVTLVASEEPKIYHVKTLTPLDAK